LIRLSMKLHGIGPTLGYQGLEFEDSAAWDGRLGANVITKEGVTRDYLRPYVVVERGGIRFGVLGLLTPETPQIIPRDVAAGLNVAPLAETVERWLAPMREDGAEFIVVLSHGGVESEQQLAEAVEGIDLIIGGHSHTVLEEPWVSAKTGTVVVQAGSRGSYLGRVDVSRDADGAFTVNGKLIAVPAQEVGRPEIEAAIETHASIVTTVMNEAVGQTTAVLTKPKRAGRGTRSAVIADGTPGGGASAERKILYPRSSALGTWLCQVMAEAAGEPIAVHNKGGIRADLPAGPIDRRALYEVSPFGNKVAVCRFKGSVLEELVKTCFEDPKRRLEVSGLEVRWTMSGGYPTYHSLLIDGAAVDPDAVYSLATNSYVAQGQDGWDAFPQESPPVILDVDVYEASVSALRALEQRGEVLAPPLTEGYPQVGSWGDRLTSAFGLLALIGLCFVISRGRKSVALRIVAWGIALQALFAFLVLETSAGQWFFETMKRMFVSIMGYAAAGNDMVFGPLASPEALSGAFGRDFVFFTQILGTIVLVSTLTAALYHIGVLQFVVYLMAKVMQWTMKTSGAESLASAANVFVGQTEAPLTVRPYLKGMTSSEIMSMMTGGMATVAGGVLAAYAGFGIDAGHLLAASVMSAPAALVVAKILVPETETPETGAQVPYEVQRTDANLLDAMCRGASEGFKLALNVMAMLIALVSIVALLNGTLEWAYLWILESVRDPAGNLPSYLPEAITLQWFLGKLFQPFAWLLGIPWGEADKVGSLLGTRMILNEFIAFLDLAAMKEALSPRSFTVATYALCGFANFSSIAIQIGGISALEGSVRVKLAKLGLLSMIGGTIATMMTAAIVGVFL
ncbi:MAG: nucleoside transporter C-terminal domain-containing protein, partial [Planctomycetota bacterium]